jgi:hypothetical protein
LYIEPLAEQPAFGRLRALSATVDATKEGAGRSRRPFFIMCESDGGVTTFSLRTFCS